MTRADLASQFAVGDQFYTQLGIDFDTRWRDWGILLCFAVFNCAVTIVASKFLVGFPLVRVEFNTHVSRTEIREPLAFSCLAPPQTCFCSFPPFS